MMNNMNELIQIKQFPVIEEKLKTIGAEAQKKVDMALSMPCTPDTKSAVKSIRTTLNADFKNLEEARKAVEKQIDEALRPFRDSYKAYITSVYKPADEQLKNKIVEVENAEKSEKLDNLKAYFEEACRFNHCDLLPFENVIPKVDLSKSETFYKKQIDSAIAQTLKDLEVIDHHECSAELLDEYMQTFNLADALVTVTDRRTRIEELTKKAQAYCEKVEKEQATIDAVEEVLSAPEIVEQEETYSMTFTVTGTMSQLKNLKEYLIKEGMYNE